MSFVEQYQARTQRSADLLARAVRSVPAGASSMERTRHRGWEPYPPFAVTGDGASLTDADGNVYLDYLLGLGPMILGHRPAAVTSAVVDAITSQGTCFALPSEWEAAAAEKVIAAVPSVDSIRFCNSGSEAVGAAVRLARAYTDRPLLVRFEGHYHGTQDIVFWTESTGGAASTQQLRVPAESGVPASLAETVVLVPWNDPVAFVEVMSTVGDRVAAVLTEPIMFNGGCIHPEPGFLEVLREQTTRYGALLIFDEVVTGFRVSRGGAQELFGVHPDLTILAKAMAGGFPAAAFGGRRSVMDLIDSGRHTHSGTYNGNLIACAAISATMDELADPLLYERCQAQTRRLADGLADLARSAGLACSAVSAGLAFSISFTEAPPRDWATAKATIDNDRYRQWHREMLLGGVLFHPNPFECFFTSTAHGPAEIDRTLEIAADATRRLRQGARS